MHNPLKFCFPFKQYNDLLRILNQIFFAIWTLSLLFCLLLTNHPHIITIQSFIMPFPFTYIMANDHIKLLWPTTVCPPPPLVFSPNSPLLFSCHKYVYEVCICPYALNHNLGSVNDWRHIIFVFLTPTSFDMVIFSPILFPESYSVHLYV